MFNCLIVTFTLFWLLVIGPWSSFAEAAIWLDPSLKWKTLETPHFSIHYYSELEEIAQRFAPTAEKVHEVLTKILKYQLDLKTQVVLLDTTDYGNGFTTVFPYPCITLYLADLGSNLSPYKYDDYLYYLFLHEYTHALHLDMAEGGPSLLRAILGRVIFPNAMEPEFITEGLATYMETHYTNAGRGRDPRWEAMIRMDVLENNLKSIDQAAVNTVKWPMGHLRYLYGVKFLEYLAQTYGEDKLISFAHVYGDFLFSLGVDAAFVFVYGKNLSMLWNEWLDYLNSKFKMQKSKLGKLTEPKLLTQTGYYNLKPKWSRDSRFIYYLQRNADDYPQIRRLELASGRSEKVLEALVFDEAFSFSPDGKYLLFSKADNFKNFYTFKDLYLLDLENRNISRITEGQRASDPCFSPSGQAIIFVKNEKGSRRLQLWTIFGISDVTSFEPGVQYFSPSFSPDGKMVAVAKHTIDGRQKIYLIDLDSKHEEILVNFDLSSTEANPCFAPGGDYIFFESDRTGIVNLYAYHLKSKKLYQITNVIGGAMMPDVSPDGSKLAYVSYSSKGYDIAVMEVDPKQWTEVRSSASSAVVRAKNETEKQNRDVADADKQDYETHDYNPWPSLMPRFWIPDSYVTETGDHTSIYIGGMDPLQHNLYYLNFGYDFEGNYPSYTVYYVNNQFLPQITLALSDWPVAYAWDSSTYWERENRNLLLFSFHRHRVFSEYDRQVFSFGLQSTKLSNLTSLEGLNPLPSLGNLNALVLGWRYLSTRQYAYSISPEDGIDLGGKVEITSSKLGSDFNFTNYSAFLRKYFRSFMKHQVFALLLEGFYSRGEQLVQGNFTWRYLTLRGYPSTYLKGNKGVSSSFEYRFPLFYPEWGLMYGATFLDRVWGEVFFDLGGATSEKIEQLKWKRAVGIETNFLLYNLWGYLGLNLKIGYARGLDEGGEEGVYFILGL